MHLLSIISLNIFILNMTMNKQQELVFAETINGDEVDVTEFVHVRF